MKIINTPTPAPCPLLAQSTQSFLFHYINDAMPFWGLVITSIGFSIPALLAFRNKRKRMGKACSVLTCTSLLYHGTQHFLWKTIDLCYAHTMGAFYSTQSLVRWIQHRRPYDFIIVCGTAGSLFLFYTGSCNKELSIHEQNKFHMAFHVISQYMLSLHALDTK